MNTTAQLYQANADFENGKNGFEGADKWESKIKDMMEGKKYEEL